MLRQNYVVIVRLLLNLSISRAALEKQSQVGGKESRIVVKQTEDAFFKNVAIGYKSSKELFNNNNNNNNIIII